MAPSPAADAPWSNARLDASDEIIAQRARALVQHQRVMDEAAEIARIAQQARRRAAASPVFACPSYPESVRSRVRWERAS